MDKSLIIYVDCKPLVNRFLDLHAGRDVEGNMELAMLIGPKQITVKLISRELNTISDSLAKSGARKKSLAQFWSNT